jgi:hypothetical protein
MSDWQTELLEKYPKTFKNLSHFECQEGWKTIIEAISKFIEDYNNTILNEENYVTASQVKSKFGGLRYYISSFAEAEDENYTQYKNNIEAIYNLISHYEGISYSICSSCGIHLEKDESGPTKIWGDKTCKNCSK